MRTMHEGTPKAYIDKVMAPGDLPRAAGVEPGEDDGGTFRSWYSETRAVASQAGGDALSLRGSHELGQRVGYRQESLNYGDYELLADFRGGNGQTFTSAGPLAAARRSQRLTLRNIGLPLTTRVFADTTVGDTFSEVTDALTRNYRLSLGTRPVRGLSTRVHSDGIDVRAGVGQRGHLLGGPFAGFESTGGQLAWAGGSVRTPAGALGLQFNRSTGPGLEAATVGVDETVDSTAAAWRITGDVTPGLGLAARVIAVRSSTKVAGRPQRADASGWFTEAAVTTDNTRQEFGAFAADPDLRFGDARLHDSRGAYWRIDSVRSGFGWGLGAQVDDQAPEDTQPGTRHYGLQANAQWQVDRRNAVGASLHVDDRRQHARVGGTHPHSRSYYATGWYQRLPHRSGRSRYMLTVRRNQELVANGDAASGEEWSWEQEWMVGGTNAGLPSVVTTLGVARDRDDRGSRLSPTAGLQLAYSPAPGWNVSANLRYTSTRSNLSTTQGLSGFLDTDYAFANGWRVGAALSINQVAVRLDGATLLPDDAPRLFRTRDTHLSLWARWEGAGGSTGRGVLGEGRSVGAGALQGRVFFDENRDGAQQSQEQGVPGVEVILDGRFRTTTDRWGRFAFPLVSTGPHRVTVRQESVPLPWGASNERGWPAAVPLRGTAEVAVPVVKVGD